MLEPLLVIVFVLAPFVLDFDDSTARTLSFVLAGLILVVGMTTQWRLSLVKLLPLRTHFTLDAMLGAAQILAPFVFGFSDETAPTAFFIVMGLAELGAALMTRWDPGDEFAVTPASGAGGARP